MAGLEVIYSPLPWPAVVSSPRQLNQWLFVKNPDLVTAIITVITTLLGGSNKAGLKEIPL